MNAFYLTAYISALGLKTPPQKVCGLFGFLKGVAYWRASRWYQVRYQNVKSGAEEKMEESGSWRGKDCGERWSLNCMDSAFVCKG